MRNSLHPLLSNSDRQKIYNRRYREKQAKIKRLSRDLDRSVNDLETLPKCAECAGHPGQACDHTPERKRHTGEAAIARAQLAEAEY